jgi:hypothetical protein
MSAPGRLRTRLTDAGRAVVGWVDDVAKARRELAESDAALRETQAQLSRQIDLNARLMARQSWDTSGGA